MNEIKIRTALRDDVDAICSIDPESDWTANDVRRNIWSLTSVVIVAFDEHRKCVVGLCYYERYSRLRVSVPRIAVREDRRRTGIGSRLIARVKSGSSVLSSPRSIKTRFKSEDEIAFKFFKSQNFLQTGFQLAADQEYMEMGWFPNLG